MPHIVLLAEVQVGTALAPERSLVNLDEEALRAHVRRDDGHEGLADFGEVARLVQHSRVRFVNDDAVFAYLSARRVQHEPHRAAVVRLHLTTTNQTFSGLSFSEIGPLPKGHRHPRRARPQMRGATTRSSGRVLRGCLLPLAKGHLREDPVCESDWGPLSSPSRTPR